jgi:hypothetical protein
MNCTDFEKQLQDRFGAARRDETADLADHARHCPPCRATLEQFQILADALGAWRAPHEVELAGAVVAARQSEFAAAAATQPASERPRVASNQSAPQTVSASKRAIAGGSVLSAGTHRSKPVRWLAAGGVAALLLVTLSLAWPNRKAPPAATTPQFAGARAIEPEGARDDLASGPPAPAAIGPPAAAPDPAQAPYYGLAQKAAGALGEVTAYVVPGSSPPPMRPAHADPEGAGAWIDGLRHQLRPIGRSLDHAFDFLWEAGQSSDSSKT